LRPTAAIVVAFGLSILANGLRSDPYTGGWWITVHFASFFLLGSLMAQNLPAIQSFYRQLSNRMLIALNIVALVLVTYGAGPPMLKSWLGDLTDWATITGLVWIIVLAVSSDTLRRFLLLPLPQFLGRISYSLYLVHATVLFALVHLFYEHIALIALLPAYIVLSVGIATLMHRYVRVADHGTGQTSRGAVCLLTADGQQANIPIYPRRNAACSSRRRCTSRRLLTMDAIMTPVVTSAIISYRSH
jgi:peptidoglycan/LPS O-acetylase OafA/YrhL